MWVRACVRREREERLEKLWLHDFGLNPIESRCASQVYENTGRSSVAYGPPNVGTRLIQVRAPLTLRRQWHEFDEQVDGILCLSWVTRKGRLTPCKSLSSLASCQASVLWCRI